MPIISEARKDDLFNDLVTSLEQKFGSNLEASPDLGQWAVNNEILLDGKIFTFKKHEYLIDIYSDKHPYQAFIKATQICATSYAMLRVFHTARYGGDNYRGIGYYFPSRTDVTDLSKTRIDPLIEDNPETIGQWMKDTNAANVKKIWNSNLFLRGMKSTIGMKCHDDQTEVLTHNGWKLFADVSIDDELATRSPTGHFMWQQAIDVYSYEYHGLMLGFYANGLDFCVTPNHRLLLINSPNDKVEWFERADRVNSRGTQAVIRTCKKWKGQFPKFIITEGRDEKGPKRFIVLPGNKINAGWESFGRHPERRINLKVFIAFLGLYVAEGTCAGVMSGERKFGRVGISQRKTSKHFLDIKKLLEKTGLVWREGKNDFRIGDMALADILFPLGNKYTKHLPNWVLDLPTEYLEILWEWALKGDGHITKAGQRIYATVSKKLADQFQEILQKCGRCASLLTRKIDESLHVKDGRPIKATTQCYLVSERKSSCSIIPKPLKIQYDGNVYCASVPNGTLLTRRNGYTFWSGNSVPIDFLVFDELDEAPPKSVDMILERMAHSEVGEKLFLSNPTLPDYGIDALWQLSDQMHWLLRCRKCNHYTNLVKTFPECLLMVKGRVIRACEKCHSELDPSDGVWVADYPSRTEIRGRQISQLYSQTKMTEPAMILNTFHTTNNLRDFFRLKIGIAYVEAQNRLSVQQVLDCCGDKGIASSSDEGTFMGVDQGNNLHVVIGKHHPKKSGEVIHIGEYLGNKEKDGSGWKQLDEMMKRFKVMRCVVDGLPETKQARAFAERFPGRVFLCFSNVYQKGSYAWSEKTMMVQANSTETLDASHQELADCSIILPAKSSDIVQEFAKHCHCIAKELETNEETGSQRYIYIRKVGGPDHYRMAFNFFAMALQDAPELMFAELL